jgi:hypothetical protein
MVDDSFAQFMIVTVDEFLNGYMQEGLPLSREQLEEVLYDFIRDDVDDIRENYGYLKMGDLQDTMEYVLDHLEEEHRIVDEGKYSYQALDNGIPFIKTTNSFREAKENYVWGTYGKDGKQPLKYVRLIGCSTEHLQAILRTQKQISPFTTRVIECILKERDTKIKLDEELFTL